ncbi:hypothetical protein [Actinoplanes sp. NBRC 101535]|uniref:hypothetical protein n=1 Tax=Actinoplanes sp. NBRC 101535 TaxID=3032196 RepID=UPI0025549563|nr:hypothetical protein [Actinoplanes sp. NBRC 101535]
MVTSEPGMAGLRRGRLKSRRARLLLALTGGITALLCLGGAGAIFLIYDQSTEIKRTAPDAVVDNFLRAYLVNRDEAQVALYACESGGDLSQISEYKNDIISRESQYSISIQVAWEDLKVSTNGNIGTVDVDLTKSISDGSEQISDSWSFGVVDDDGWRVCSSERL